MQFTTTQYTSKMTSKYNKEFLRFYKTKPYETDINHAPNAKKFVRKKMALRNALRYFEPQHHAELIQEFSEELETYGRIYMYRLRPDYEMRARQLMNIRKI
jgi:urocanate hydratase